MPGRADGARNRRAVRDATERLLAEGGGDHVSLDRVAVLAGVGVWDVPVVAAAADGLAGPLLRDGDPESAARLLGAAAALLAGTGAADAPAGTPTAGA